MQVNSFSYADNKGTLAKIILKKPLPAAKYYALKKVLSQQGKTTRILNHTKNEH